MNNIKFSTNPQYEARMASDGPIFISLSQKDRRVDRTQQNSKYPPIGITIVHKKADGYRTDLVAQTHVIALSNYVASREVSIEIESKKGECVAIMPNTFEAGVQMPFYLKVYSRSIEDIKLVDKDAPAAQVKGAWDAKNGGGCLNNPSWVDNPQYLLTVNKKTDVPIALTQAGVDGRPTHIGLYLWKTTTGYRNLLPSGIVWQSPLIDSGTVSEVVPLDQGQYVIMPCTFHPQKFTTYELKASSSDCSLGPVKEFISKSIDGEWKAGQCGGCQNTAQWTQNPKLKLVVKEAASITITVSVKDKLPIGFYVFDPALKTRLQTSKFIQGNSSSHDCKLNVGEYCILPCTFNPNTMGKFSVSVFADAPFDLSY